MGIDNFSSNVKLNSVKAYKSTNKASDIFKKNFYSDVNGMNYDSYEEIDYNNIDEIEYKNTSTLRNNEKATSKNPEIKTKKEKSKVKKPKKKKKQPWYMKGLSLVKDYAVTAVASVTCGALEVVENVGDCGAMIIGKVASATGNEELKETMSDFVKKDWTEDLYQDIVKAADVDEDIANGAVHTVGNFIGTAAGYVAVNSIPGGQIVAGMIGAASAMGSTSEMALKSGADFDTAFDCGAVAAVMGATAGAGLKSIQFAAKGATSLAGVAGYTLAGAGVSALEPFANSLFQYNAYGKGAVDEYGNPLYNDFWDYYKESGALFQTITAGAIGGSSTGLTANQSYMGTKKFIKSNLDDEFSNRKWDYVKENYVDEFGEGAFDKLSEQEKNSLLEHDNFTKQEISDLKKQAKQGIKENINNSINNVSSDYRNGKYNKNYSVGDILSDYKGDQTKYWSDTALAKYYNEFLQNADSNGNVKVYCFQNAKEGAKNYKSFNGAVGYKDGCFVMSEDSYKKLLQNREIFDSSGKVIDSAALGEYLGGVDFGHSKNIIALEQTVNISDVKIPNGSYNGAFPGYWSPGGKTISTATGKPAATEAIVPQGNIKNGNIKIINH